MFYRSPLTDQFLRLAIAALLVYTNQSKIGLVWDVFIYGRDAYVKSVTYNHLVYRYPYPFGVDPVTSYWMAIASGGGVAVILFKFMNR